ncbi:uncharacterized protein VTP21DRAFT_6212 [Calcarisporiella thermophila]|uniref:uncharacterized protein n=1 Tax=Calcarisporiella thermophila TaxID=911321 RepID=UPI0037434A0C
MSDLDETSSVNRPKIKPRRLTRTPSKSSNSNLTASPDAARPSRLEDDFAFFSHNPLFRRESDGKSIATKHYLVISSSDEEDERSRHAVQPGGEKEDKGKTAKRARHSEEVTESANIITIEDDSDETTDQPNSPPMDLSNAEVENDQELLVPSPPAISQDQMETILLLYRSKLDSQFSTSSNEFEPSAPPSQLDFLPSSELDPELLSIAETTRGLTPTTGRHKDETGSSQNNNYSDLLLHAHNDNKNPRKISIKVIMNENTSANYQTMFPHRMVRMPKLLKPVRYYVYSNHQFEKIYSNYCERMGLTREQIVLVYQGTRIFSSGTPDSLDMPEKVEVFAFFKDIYEIMQQQKMKDLEERFARENEAGYEPQQPELNSLPQQNNVGGSAATTGNRGNEHWGILKLRDKGGEDIKLKVKMNTTVGAIVGKYIQIKGIPDSMRVSLSFEGEGLDPSLEIAKSELEDGDMLFVKVEN